MRVSVFAIANYSPKKRRFWTDLEKCVTGEKRVLGCEGSDVDGRYFGFGKSDFVGYVTSGLARIAGLHLMLSENRRLDERQWLTAWKREEGLKNNVMAGYFAERTAIAVVANSFFRTYPVKLPEEVQLLCPIPIRLFSDPPVEPLKGIDDEGAILWVPHQYNYPAVDAILIFKYRVPRTTRFLVRLYPIQITIASFHEHSSKQFLAEEEGVWVRHIENGGHTLESVNFLWLCRPHLSKKKYKGVEPGTPTYTREEESFDVDSFCKYMKVSS